MKRIGIITHLHNSTNYGGVLQAYALCKVLNKNGVYAEQILFPLSLEKVDNNSKSKKSLTLFIKLIFSRLRFYYIICRTKKYKKKLLERKKLFSEFVNKYINHSDVIYDNKSIKNCTGYDILITGSDQVWNYSWFNSAYFLNFSPNSKKISYAASIGHDDIPLEWQKILSGYLCDFSAISVREEDSVVLIKKITNKNVKYVLDPTLLLSTEDWEKICDKRYIDEEYIFCYFLGNDKKNWKIAKKVARQRHMRLVAIPFIRNKYTANESRYADFRFLDISPTGFLSLIKYASLVLTDSFHAVVFSNVFKKEFFVFNRDSHDTMNGRISNIVKMFGEESRYCKNKNMVNIEYILSQNKIDYNKTNQKLNLLIEKSLNYLWDNI